MGWLSKVTRRKKTRESVSTSKRLGRGSRARSSELGIFVQCRANDGLTQKCNHGSRVRGLIGHSESCGFSRAASFSPRVGGES